MRYIILAALCSCLFLKINAQPGVLDLSFNPLGSVNAPAKKIAVQPNGKIIVVGEFTEYNGVLAKYIVRINPDGSKDTSFQTGTGFNFITFTVAIQPDNKILIGGDFVEYNGTSSSRIIRLNSNGSVDNTFVIGTGFNNVVHTIAIQPDGKILAGGRFTQYNGINCNRIVRLNSNGSVDNTFKSIPGASSTVEIIELQPDGKIMIGGDFNSYDNFSNIRIARADIDGSKDAAFADTIFASRAVKCFGIQPNGYIVVGGNFVVFNLQAKNRFEKITPNGLQDIFFNVGQGANDRIEGIKIMNDGNILLAGAFTKIKNQSLNRLAMIDSFGNINYSFNTGIGADEYINSLAIQPDGKILIAGAFKSYNGITRNGIARLYNCLTPQPDTILGLTYAECRGTVQTYTINPVAGATKYEWTLPNGWTGSSDSASITAISDGSGGTISVKAFTPQCGFSYATTLSIATLQPPGINICLVTVDTASTHNIIIWENQGYQLNR